MLRRLAVKGFKSLADVEVTLPRMTVLFGPNAAGKSNLLDAVQALSRIGTSRTLTDALADPIRGHPIELFEFPPEGLPGLLGQETASFSVEADIETIRENFRYRIAVEIQPGSGKLLVKDEYLANLGKGGVPKGTPRIEVVNGRLHLRKRREKGKPKYEDIGQNYAMVSDPRHVTPTYHAMDQVRRELSSWRTYYLDPRGAMRSSRPPADVRDIGQLGEDIAPFLYRLQAESPPRAFNAIRRTLRSLIPSVEDLKVDLDKRRGTLDIQVRQAGVDYSSRIVSEGTLRVLALCAVTVNPWSSNLLAFEEPENGVHPRRIELIARLLSSLALEQRKQLIVTTHSPIFCDAVLRIARDHGKAQSPGSEIGLFNVKRTPPGTTLQPFDTTGPLFGNAEILQSLTASTEDGVFEGLMLRGMFDE